MVLEEEDGEKRTFRVEAASSVPENFRADVAIILTKAHRTEAAATLAQQVLSPESDWNLALTLQNGYGNAEILEATLGPGRAFAGITTQAAQLIAPGHVRDNGQGPVWLPAPPGAEEKIKALGQLLESAGFEVRISEETEALLWKKLVINASINPLTAVLGVRNGELSRNPKYRKVLYALAHEVVAVATARGLELGIPDPGQYAADVCDSTAENQSSMLRDILSSRPTEVGVINGVIVQEGEKHGVHTPWNQLMLRYINELESEIRKPDQNIRLEI